MENKNYQDFIRKEIKDNDIVLFMKGTKESPRCGFSQVVVAILNQMKVDYKVFDVLKDNILREEIKIFSDWPTIPQLYVRGEFIGGCDIVTDMHKNGELAQLLKEK